MISAAAGGGVHTALLIGGAVVLALLLILMLQRGRKIGRYETRRGFADTVRSERNDAVKRSRAVLSGQMAEQIAPFLQGFPCNPADVRFVGKPVDFVAFPGASAGQEIQEVLLIEVKTGTSALSKRESEIKKAVQAGRVRYVVYNPDVGVRE